MAQRISHWWAAVSIRHKFNLFIWLTELSVIALCLYLLGILNTHMTDFNEILGDSYFINYSFTSFEGENNAFIALSQSASDENRTLYEAAKQRTQKAIAQLVPDFLNNSTDRYLITQAVHNAYNYYGMACEDLLRSPDRGIDYASRYYAAQGVADYIEHYLQQLMKDSLDSGTASYAEKLADMRILPTVGFILSGLVVCSAAFFSVLAMRQIIRPVVQMAENTSRIAENDLDVPDIHVKNNDEIGRLALAFNRMKDSMRQHILTLREVNQMEAQLHADELRKVELEQQLKAMQLSVLQNQINPHFLFNTLGTIRSTAKIESASNTEELIQRLANLFRYNLQTSGVVVSLEREMSIIEDYIYIQQRRFGSRLRFFADCRVDKTTIYIPAFTLQPLVENAIIHGISPKEEGGGIRIRIFRRANRLNICITDNGQGISAEKRSALLDPAVSQSGHLSHIGIGNVKSRLDLLFPGSTFNMYSHEGLGTSVRVSIPMDEEWLDV